MGETGFDKKGYFENLDIQTILGISYIFAVGIGMLFTYQKYSLFGINIFDYADVFDFLIAPFSDLSIILFTVGSLGIVYIVFVFDNWSKKKFPRVYSALSLGTSKKSWFGIYQVLIAIFTATVLIHYASNYYGKITVNKINRQEPVVVRYSDNEIKEGIMIGKTKEVVFMLSDSVVSAVPITGLVKEIEL